MNEFIVMFAMNLVTPKAAAKHECLLNKSSHLAAAFGVFKLINIIARNLATLCCVTEVRLRHSASEVGLLKT